MIDREPKDLKKIITFDKKEIIVAAIKNGKFKVFWKSK